MKYFSPNEFSDFSKMDMEFIEWLEELRKQYGKPIRINSSYRDPGHNADAGGVKNSAHTETPCKAVDIHCTSSLDRFALVTLALKMGCMRIGIGETFVHLDWSDKRPSPRLWHYYK